LQDCREKQVKVELGDSNASSDKTQVDLQQRIMSILNNDNKPSDGPRGIPPLIPNLQSYSDVDKGDNFDNTAMRSQIDLRERIASMLNSNTSLEPVPQPVAAPNMKTSITNPTIQRALDSLLNKMN